MYLNGDALTYSYLSNASSDEIVSAFDYVKLLGKQKCNYIQIKNSTMSDEDLDSIQYDDVPIWTNDTSFLVKFDTLEDGSHTLEAGNVIGLDGTISGVNLQRRNGTDTFSVDLGNIDVSKNNFEDLTCSSNKNYVYSITPYSDTAQGMESKSEYINTCFYNWSLTYLKENIVFLFDLNVSTDSIKSNIDSTIQKTYTEYPKIQFGNNKYQNGKITAMLGTIDQITGEGSSIDFYNKLRDCIASGEQAILKSRKGDFWYVVCTSISKQYIDEITQQPYFVSFEWNEVAEPMKN